MFRSRKEKIKWPSQWYLIFQKYLCIGKRHYHRTGNSCRITGGEQKLSAITANQPISENLHIKKGKPVLHLQRKMHTNKTGVNIYSSTFCNTERFYLQGLF